MVIYCGAKLMVFSFCDLTIVFNQLISQQPRFTAGDTVLGPLDPEICFLDDLYVGVTFCLRFVLHMFHFWFTFQLWFQLPAQDLWLLPQGPAGVRLPTWHLPTCEVEKRVAAFLDFGVTACNAAWVYFTSVYLFWQVEFMGLLPLTWVYCL